VFFLSGLLIFISTACSNNPPTAQSSAEGSLSETKGLKSELPSQIQPKQKGELYSYNNTDKDIVKRVKDVSEKVSNSTSEAAENLIEGTKNNLRQVKNNTKQALDQAQNMAEKTSTGIKRQASKSAQQIKDKAGDIEQGIQKTL
jgi:hypothetical protein